MEVLWHSSQNGSLSTTEKVISPSANTLFSHPEKNKYNGCKSNNYSLTYDVKRPNLRRQALSLLVKYYTVPSCQVLQLACTVCSTLRYVFSFRTTGFYFTPLSGQLRKNALHALLIMKDTPSRIESNARLSSEGSARRKRRQRGTCRARAPADCRSGLAAHMRLFYFFFSM